MKLEKLQDDFDCDKDFSINEDEKNSKYLAQMKFKFGKADILNGNNRIYPSKVLQTAFKNFNKKAELRKILSSIDHPFGKDVELKNVSHVVEKTYIDAEKNLWAEGGLLKTSKGRDIFAILKSGGKIGSSMRGFGKLGTDNKVESGYTMTGIDFVASPSFGKDAEVTSANVLSESLSVEITEEEFFITENERKWSGERRTDKELKELIEKQEKLRPTVLESRLYEEAKLSGTNLTRDEFIKMLRKI